MASVMIMRGGRKLPHRTDSREHEEAGIGRCQKAGRQRLRSEHACHHELITGPMLYTLFASVGLPTAAHARYTIGDILVPAGADPNMESIIVCKMRPCTAVQDGRTGRGLRLSTVALSSHRSSRF